MMKHLKSYGSINESKANQSWEITVFDTLGTDGKIIHGEAVIGEYPSTDNTVLFEYKISNKQIKLSSIGTSSSSVNSGDKYNNARIERFESLTKEQREDLKIKISNAVTKFIERQKKKDERTKERNEANSVKIPEVIKNIKSGDTITVYYNGTGYDLNSNAYKVKAKGSPYMDGPDIYINTQYKQGDNKAIFKHGKWRNGAAWFERTINKRN
jgi:hypothetical protein